MDITIDEATAYVLGRMATWDGETGPVVKAERGTCDDMQVVFVSVEHTYEGRKTVADWAAWAFTDEAGERHVYGEW